MNNRSLRVNDKLKYTKQLHITETTQTSRKETNDNSIFELISKIGNIHTINGKTQRSIKTTTYLLDGKDVNFLIYTNLAITKNIAVRILI